MLFAPRTTRLIAKETGKIITAEEHNTIGGLGSAVADVLAEEGLGIKFKNLACQMFMQPMDHQMNCMRNMVLKQREL